MIHEPNWSCEWCGKRYYRHPCFFRNGRKVCCSVSCGLYLRGRKPVEVRFWKYVVKGPGCWGWTGGTSASGYGRISICQEDGMAQAHRVSYELHNGPIPEGMDVLHSCDNLPYTRPDHLFLGTNADNVADKVAKGRQMRGSRMPMSKLTEENVIEIKRRLAAGEGPSRLAREFKVSPPTLSDIISGRTWKHLS